MERDQELEEILQELALNVLSVIKPISVTKADVDEVGKANDPKKRYRERLREDRTASTYKVNWIQSLLHKDLKPVLEVLGEVSIDTWKERERYLLYRLI